MLLIPLIYLKSKIYILIKIYYFRRMNLMILRKHEHLKIVYLFIYIRDIMLKIIAYITIL